jgi:hypothetical protein
MKRRSLDALFSLSGLVAALLLVAIGLVLSSNANFSDRFVGDQLRQQRLSFPPLDKLTDEEQARPCLVANAGKSVLTGAQAECYAKDFVGLHLGAIAGGATFADLGGQQVMLRSQLAALPPGSPAAPAIQANLDQVSTQRDALFKGETLRAQLLSSYGFEVFGMKFRQVATVAYVGAALLVLLSLAEFGRTASAARDEAASSGTHPALLTRLKPRRHHAAA